MLYQLNFVNQIMNIPKFPDAPNEVGFWIIVTLCVIALLLFKRWARKTSSARLYKSGQAEGRKFQTEGLPRASIESFLRVQRDGGLYGPYEAGIASVLSGEKK